jgi:hypothetical protein
VKWYTALQFPRHYCQPCFRQLRKAATLGHILDREIHLRSELKERREDPLLLVVLLLLRLCFIGSMIRSRFGSGGCCRQNANDFSSLLAADYRSRKYWHIMAQFKFPLIFNLKL